MVSQQVDLSVVIPAYNEEKFLPLCLQSISELTTDKDFEVIVVDNNATDKTAQIAKEFQETLNLRVISEERQGRGAARKRGFDEALGRVIVSLDADTIVYPDWMDILLEGIKGDVVAVTTSCKIEDCPLLTKAIFNFLQPKVMVLYRILFGHFWLSGFSFAILEATYVKSGKFNPNLQGQEDIDLSFRVARLGKIKFINKPVIFSGRRFQKGLVRGFYQYIHTFIEAFLLRRQDVYLDNPR